MTPFQALFYNFMSGQAVYLGCAIGIFLFCILLNGSAKKFKELIGILNVLKLDIVYSFSL
jgi:hypothetical protein